jgi:hypothetical protein
MILKYTLFSTLFFITLVISAQCDYDVVDVDFKKNDVYLETISQILSIYETPSSGRIILAKLVRDRNNILIDIEITEDSKYEKLKPVCFKNSKLSLLFKDNSLITLHQIYEEICGVRKKDRKSGFQSMSNYARFIIHKEAFEKLKQEEITLMKLISKDYTTKFVLKSELENIVEDDVFYTYPTRFFIDYIDCLINPKINQ